MVAPSSLNRPQVIHSGDAFKPTLMAHSSVLTWETCEDTAVRGYAVVVKFLSRSTRDRILKAAKKHRLNRLTLGFEGNEPVFINEHLCPEYKVLLGKAIQLKREKTGSFCVWLTAGS